MFMFVVFYSSFGEEFLLPSMALLVVEVLILIVKSINWSFLFKLFSQDHIYRDDEHDREMIDR